MNTPLVSEYERILLVTREQLLHDLNQAEAEEEEPQFLSGGSAIRWAEGAEIASDVQEQEADFVQMSRLSSRLELVDEALRLLRDDPEAFAACRHCGGEIAEKRLHLVPWSRLCAACARGKPGEAEGA